MMRSSNTERSWTASYVLVLLLVALAAITIKIVYLNTAESGYNAEELPLSPMTLVSGNDAVSNVASTRLYGTANITTAASLKLFGFSVFALKAPNMLFFLLSLVFLYLFSRRYFSRVGKWAEWYALMPSALLCLGPPVIQIWGMKNRGGFIESIFALTLCLWICASARDGLLSSIQKLMLAIIIGLATWSQPIALLWGVIIIVYIIASDLLADPRSLPKDALLVGFGLTVGLLPLIALNFMFRFNTLRVIEGGEVPGGIDLGNLGRLQQMITDGIPRLLGLKEQWNPDWIIPTPLAYVLYGLFLLPVAIAVGRNLGEALRSRRFTLGLVLVAVSTAVILANVFSSWGNFQSEPRRLLLLYIPLAVLIACGLSRTPRLAVAYLALWIGFNAWSNYTYISKHLDGFSHRVYRPLDSVATFLQENGVNGIYSDVWTGGRVTFASDGTIPWFRSKYVATSYGFVGDDELSRKEAMVFNAHTPGGSDGRRMFSRDIRRAGIHCSERTMGGISMYFGCDREFEFEDLRAAAGVAAVPGQVLIDLNAADSMMATQVGTRNGEAIRAGGEGGFLVYGPYLPLPAGQYSLLVKGTSSDPFILDLAADQGRVVLVREEFRRGEDPSASVLATLEFRLDRAVEDFEVRVRVADAADTQVRGYAVTYLQP